MEQIFDLIIAKIVGNQDDAVEIMLLAIAGAVISWALVEPIMYALFSKETADRWKPVGFFIINSLFFMLVLVGEAASDKFGPYPFWASIIFLSALSAAIYAMWPKMLRGLAGAANRYAEGSALDKKLNGDNDE